MKTTYSTMLLVIGFMALMLMLPSAYLNAELTSNPNNSPVSISQTDTTGLNQLESPLLMAQATEEHRSSESSSSSTVETPQPVQEDRSSESSSSSSMKSTTTEAQPAPPEHCVSRCSEHYKQRLAECNEPGHPKHEKCSKWAREQEQECLNECSRR